MPDAARAGSCADPPVQAAHNDAVAAGKAHYADPETGYLVFTAPYLAARGYCCGCGCRHCPYSPEEQRRANRPGAEHRQVELHQWHDRDDTTAIQQLASRAWPFGPHPGGLGWSAALGGIGDAVVLATDAGLRGWAALTDGEIVLGFDRARPGVVDTLVAWASSVARDGPLSTPVVDGDDVLRTRLSTLGFRRHDGGAPVSGMFRQAAVLPYALLPGYRLRPTDPDEVGRRVEVHRAAWLPSSLPWAPGARPSLPPDATSAFTEASYEAVRATWLYDRDLDLVVDAPDGTLAASCIAWYDPASRCAEIEPLGVVPEHRRRGLAGALCLEVCARCAARGGDLVYINQRARADYPVPAAAYRKVGFEVVDRGTYYARV